MKYKIMQEKDLNGEKVYYLKKVSKDGFDKKFWQTVYTGYPFNLERLEFATIAAAEKYVKSKIIITREIKTIEG